MPRAITITDLLAEARERLKDIEADLRVWRAYPHTESLQDFRRQHRLTLALVKLLEGLESAKETPALDVLVGGGTLGKERTEVLQRATERAENGSAADERRGR